MFPQDFPGDFRLLLAETVPAFFANRSCRVFAFYAR